ncbi:MAG: carbonic anhydrase family protein [Bacteroidales bacterium]|nr:carbonic anhydrase family protein [Bacteroidales bacterium]
MNRKNVFKFAAISLAVFMYSCNSGSNHSDEHGTDSTHKDTTAHKEHEAAHWSYEGETAPNNWATECGFEACSGKHQSPIDIAAATASQELVDLKLDYKGTEKCVFINNGHTVQVNITESVNNTFTLNDKTYKLKQFHFHCPSEHTIAGKPFVSEVHLVHKTDAGDIAVIGVLIEEGTENLFLASILDELPKKAEAEDEIDNSVNPSDLLPADDNYYAYDGSLTTPPCTEGVKWFVLKTPIKASKAQIEALEAAMPDNNARPVQPVNDRMVKEAI